MGTTACVADGIGVVTPRAKTMSKGNQRCGNCRYWYEARELDGSGPITRRTRGGVATVGACRRHPPVLDVNPDSHDARENNSAIPHATDSWWCGEWQAEEPTTNDETLLQLAREVLRGDRAAALALVDRLTVDTA